MVCELSDLFDLIKSRSNTNNYFLDSSAGLQSGASRYLFANIEVKSPFDPAVRPLYRRSRCAKLISDLIRQYQMEPYCLVQSFDFEMLDEIDSLNSEHQGPTSNKIRTLYIHNFYYYYPVEDEEAALRQGAGGHL